MRKSNMSNNLSIKFSLIGDNSAKKQKTFAFQKKNTYQKNNQQVASFATLSQQKSDLLKTAELGNDIEHEEGQ